MASTLSLRLQPPLVPGLQRLPLKPRFPLSCKFHKNPNPSTFFPKSPVSASLSSPDPRSSSSWEKEEIRWLREEQRWLREEQRWLREESRWSAERESLLREIAALQLRIEALERERLASISAASGRLKTVLQAENVGGSIPEAAGHDPVLVEDVKVKEVVLEKIRVSEGSKKRKTLRKGAEGEDVLEMQEALQRLGFYSGEEDMEFSSFSTGTERAVKTWQASLGTREDGIMTPELLERLFMERGPIKAGLEVITDQKGDSASVVGTEGVNGASIASITEVADIQETVVKGIGNAEVEVSQHRVFLLGENRWEEPSRLVGRNNKPTGRGKAVSAKKCLACRGEGRLMCTECDGSGEPNIEPQFLEWIDEGAKCPYCGGVGHTICDVCQGNGIIQT